LARGVCGGILTTVTPASPKISPNGE